MSPRKEHPKWLRVVLVAVSVTCFSVWCLWVAAKITGEPSLLAVGESLPPLSRTSALGFLLLAAFFAFLNNERRWLNVPIGALLVIHGAWAVYSALLGEQVPLNTGVGIVGLGAAALIVGIWREARYTPMAVATIGSLVAAIAFLALLGQATGITLA